MRFLKLMMAAPIALAVATPALADCDGELHSLRKKIEAEQANYHTMVIGEVRPDVRKLRDAARTFQRYGQEEACEEVVAGIRNILDKRREQLESAGKLPDAEEWSKGELARVESAQPVAEIGGPVRANRVIGADVRNLANEDLGEIEDVIVDPKEGDIVYAIVAHGGFLGLGEELLAVPWQKFKVTADRDVFIINTSADALDDAPRFRPNDWQKTGDAGWRQKNNAYYDRHVN